MYDTSSGSLVTCELCSVACVGGVGGAGGVARPQPRPLSQVTRDADTRAEHREQSQHIPPPATTNRGHRTHFRIFHPGSLLAFFIQ